MAIFTAIRNKTQSSDAMKNALDYIKRRDKTLWGDCQLVTGWNCVAQSAYDEMMTSKRRHGKTDERMFYQFVQSFSPEEHVTPEEVHAVGLELAQKLFPDFEVVVATHVDTDHLHSHLIVNSVSCITGRKLHQNAAVLQRQLQISDEICAAHGLTVLEPPQKYTQEKKMRPGEYRSAIRGESWKFRLINTIDLCMRTARTRAEFLQEMERRGYWVQWEDKRKSITYTTPKGKKCRDDRLHDERYRKEVMEREFRIREAMLHGGVEKAEPTAGAGCPINTSPLPLGGTMGEPAGHSGRPAPSAGGAEPTVGADTEKANRLRHEGSGVGDDKAALHDTGEHRTGWEAERTEAFSAQTASSAADHSNIQGDLLHTCVVSGIGNSLIRLGYHLEQSSETAPAAGPVIGHGDRKALAKERQKKIALGQKPDDHEEQQNMNLSS